jgi:hypothetical protein
MLTKQNQLKHHLLLYCLKLYNFLYVFNNHQLILKIFIDFVIYHLSILHDDGPIMHIMEQCRMTHLELKEGGEETKIFSLLTN